MVHRYIPHLEGRNHKHGSIRRSIFTQVGLSEANSVAMRCSSGLSAYACTFQSSLITTCTRVTGGSTTGMESRSAKIRLSEKDSGGESPTYRESSLVRVDLHKCTPSEAMRQAGQGYAAYYASISRAKNEDMHMSHALMLLSSRLKTCHCALDKDTILNLITPEPSQNMSGLDFELDIPGTERLVDGGYFPHLSSSFADSCH